MLGCEYSPRRNVRASILGLEGIVTVQTDRHSPQLPLVEKAGLDAGAIIRTERSSRAAIAMLPNALIELLEETKLEILSLTLIKNGNETEDPMQDRFGSVKLWRGAIFLSHERRDTARAVFKITTSQGEAMTATNCLFKLDAGNHHARLTSISGDIQFQMLENPKATRIPPGNVAEWNSGVASLVPAATDRIGQLDVTAGLEAGDRLRAMRSSRRDLPPRVGW